MRRMLAYAWWPFLLFDPSQYIFLFPSYSLWSAVCWGCLYVMLKGPSLNQVITIWEWVFSFPSRSRIVGMDFFHSLPVPEVWEWIFVIPFPFPNWLFHRRESKRELDYCKRYASNFSASSTFLKTIILRRWIEPRCSKVSDWKDRTFCSVLLQIVLLQRC